MSSKSIAVFRTCSKRLCAQRSKYFHLNLRRFAHKYPPRRASPLEPSRYMAIYRDLHGAIDEPAAAKDFVYALDKNERQLLRSELESFERMEKQLEGNTCMYIVF